MAIVKQDMYVIRDKIENVLMEGAKGQLAFDTQGHARKSLVHTGWWTYYKMYRTIRKFMPNGERLVDEFEHLTRLVQKEDYQNRDPKLSAARNDVNKEIMDWKRGNKEYVEEFRKLKFDKQTRYAVESLILIETKEI